MHRHRAHHRLLTFIITSIAVGLCAVPSVAHRVSAATSTASDIGYNLAVVFELALLTAALDQLHDVDSNCVDRTRRMLIAGNVSDTGSNLNLTFYTGGRPDLGAGIPDGDHVEWTTTFNPATRRATSAGSGRLIEAFSAEGAYQFSEQGPTGSTSLISRDGKAQWAGEQFGTQPVRWGFIKHYGRAEGELAISRPGGAILAHYYRNDSSLTPLTTGFCRLTVRTLTVAADNSFVGEARFQFVPPR